MDAINKKKELNNSSTSKNIIKLNSIQKVNFFIDFLRIKFFF